MKTGHKRILINSEMISTGVGSFAQGDITEQPNAIADPWLQPNKDGFCIASEVADDTPLTVDSKGNELIPTKPKVVLKNPPVAVVPDKSQNKKK